jgi:hypothetical protein
VPAKKPPMSRVLHLEDRGQEFLRFHVNEFNVIVRTEPQGAEWNGWTVKQKADREGFYPTLLKPGEKPVKLKYRVLKVSKDQAAEPMKRKPQSVSVSEQKQEGKW